MTTSTARAERAWLSVEVDALVRNARQIAALVDRPLLPMLKANAYGLGAVAAARALEALEPWGYGVATLDEGMELRAAGLTRPIVVFTPAHPDAVSAYAEHRLRAVIGDFEALEAWAGASQPFHLELDTGMSRSGFRWHDTQAITALRGRLGRETSCEGVFTHFHSSDTDPSATGEQWLRLEQFVSGLPARPALVHAANSAACAAGTRYAGDLVRPGIFLYGGNAGTLRPEPVARLEARVVALRRLRPGDTVSYDAEATVPSATDVATLAIGYADGVPRSLGGRGHVELNGRRLPILGRVTMDMMMIDLQGRPAARGDVATIFGGAIPLDEQASQAGTNSYELLSRISARVPRRYRSEPTA